MILGLDFSFHSFKVVDAAISSSRGKKAEPLAKKRKLAIPHHSETQLPGFLQHSTAAFRCSCTTDHGCRLSRLLKIQWYSKRKILSARRLHVSLPKAFVKVSDFRNGSGLVFFLKGVVFSHPLPVAADTTGSGTTF